MTELLLKDEVYAIIGVGMEVHNVLGSGFLEAVYHEAMEIEPRKQNIPYISQSQLPIYYKEHLLKKTYVADFICFNKIVVEIKVINHLSSLEEAQLLNYMKAGTFKVGLLINFGAESLQWKRMVLSKEERISENSRN